MPMAGSDITVEILKDIRDDMRGVRTELREELGSVRTEIHQLRTDTNERFETVEIVLRERFETLETVRSHLAGQQRFVGRYTKAGAERESRLDGRVSSLESRVDKLES